MLSQELQEASPGQQLLQEFDNYYGVRNALKALAQVRGHWAGIPIPIGDLDMVLDPKFPYAEGFIEAGMAYEPGELDKKAAKEGYKIRNIFWSRRWRCTIIVLEKEGRVKFYPCAGTGTQATMELNTLLASDAWGLEQESRAQHLLGELVGFRAFKMYLLTGRFLETSKRSGITYMFRKLRPTLAITKRDDELFTLCTLCMHPVGYYHGSWGGVMCPTDDVIAHLMLMRADERRFWSRCNQHESTSPLSGI